MSGGERLGWIGAGGRMGIEMVQRLLRGGYEVEAYNRTRSKLDPLVELGAEVVSTPRELSGCTIVFTTIAGDSDLDEVLFGPDGVAQGGGRPEVVVDLSTVSAEASGAARRRLAEQGTAMLAAPVSGNAKVIASGMLSVVASGPEDTFTRVAPYLEALGRRVTYVGDGDRARLVKICHNLYLGMVINALVEISVLAEKGGIARADMLEFINTSVMGSVFSQYKSPPLVHLDFHPTFTCELLLKDLTLGTDIADHLGVPLPGTEVVRDAVRAAIDAGFAGEDFASMIVPRAQAAGLELEPDGRPVPSGFDGGAASGSA
jgi:3-hydroxyisobutyrate dehydrogenase-like beta-hydroxyacid dehydrogenase